MNFNANTFVVSIGEYVHAIAYNAPWMNNKPISYEHAYLIFIALHEELFNETFHWSKIDNSVQDAVARVYTGFAALVPAPPKLWRYGYDGWRLVNTVTPGQQVVDLPYGSGLPPKGTERTVYRVHGGKTFDGCFNNLVDNTLTMIRWSLRNELNKYLGTSRNYEWYFEYSGNGIVYTRQGRNELSYLEVEPQPETEAELIHHEINLLPKVDQPVPKVVVNLCGYESRGGDDGEDKFASIMQNVYGMVNQLYAEAMQSGAQQAEILIKFANPAFLREMCDYLQTLNQGLPIKLIIKTEQVQVDPGYQQQEQVNRALQERSIAQMNRDAMSLAEQLVEIRNRIARRNNVQDFDIKEIQSLAPEILTQTALMDDIYVSVNNREHWYKFGDVNPLELQHPVIGMCLLLSNHIDTLTGYSKPTKAIPTYQARDLDVPVGVTPLYCN